MIQKNNDIYLASIFCIRIYTYILDIRIYTWRIIHHRNDTLEHWHCNISILHHGNDTFEQCTCNASMYRHNDILEHWHV